MNYKFIFTDTLTSDKMEFDINFNGKNIANFVEKTIKKNLKKLGELVSYFGSINTRVYDENREVAKGEIIVNCFAGKTLLKINVVK